MSHAIIIVDVQNDFCEGGSLAVPGGADVAESISGWVNSAAADHVVATRDHHIYPGAHFSDNPDFVNSWPRHCVAGTHGAEFHPNLTTDRIETVFDKGEYDAGYSGFSGHSGPDSLGEWLANHSVDSVEIVGIATDHCVRATALDAAQAGLAVTVRLDLTAAVSRETTDAALNSLREAGVVLTGEPVLQG